MYAWYENNSMNIAALLSEDVGAPELRSPRLSGIRADSWLSRLLKKRA